MSIPSDLLRRGRELLCAAREDQRGWDPLRLQLAAGLDGTDEDANERNRMEVAWALQYDAVPADAALVRFVLGQEVEWRRVAPWQGIGDTLEILSWLVARDRDVRDVALLASAKTANFDTSCGFAREHLFASGVEATVAYARTAETPEILGELVTEDGASMCSEDEVRDWHGRQARRFATSPADEALECWIERALARAAFALTEEFASATPRLPLVTLAAAVAAAGQVGDHERVRHYQERLSEERAHVTSQIAGL